MRSAAAASFGGTTNGQGPFILLLIYSVLFHIFVLCVVPVATKLIWQPKKFSRPRTFQLVRVPPPRPKRRRSREAVRKPVKERSKKTPVPARDPSQPVEKPREEEESLDDLASLLEELPIPTSVSAPSNFKWNWYVNNVQQKIERNWIPSQENRDLSVIVAFTIFPTGTISEPAVKKSSGNGSLDNLAVRAVRLAAPFGKLPPGFMGNQLDLRCELKPVRR